MVPAILIFDIHPIVVQFSWCRQKNRKGQKTVYILWSLEDRGDLFILVYILYGGNLWPLHPSYARWLVLGPGENDAAQKAEGKLLWVAFPNGRREQFFGPRGVRKFMYIAYSGMVDGENSLKLFAMVVHDRLVESFLELATIRRKTGGMWRFFEGCLVVA